ncbi:transglycosylase family protein [Mycobacterium intracellulare]|uniref:transglycosylase family protein n=1 Tax=Mycobacterium intracellulare TaxID=1767 RepID=UPI0018E0AC7D|nr:transglycosylase family protein [Mycobacterium intracellulare]
MASDDDLIYVDVVPRLDEAEAEKATGRLRDKLKDGVKGAGKAVSDVFHSELAEELGRSIGPIAHDMGVELGKQLGSKAGDLLHEQISDALKGVGVDFDGIIDKAHDLADQFGVDADSVGKLADAFKAAKTGDQTKAFDDLAQALQKVPGPVGEVAQKSKGLLDTFSSLKGDIKETAHGFMDLTNNSGAIAGGLDAIASAAGPLAATFAALDTLMPGFDQHLNNVIAQMQGKQSFNPKDWFNTLVPGTNLFDKAMQPFAGSTSGNSPIPAKPGVPLPPGPTTPAAPPGYTASPGSLDPFSALLPPGVKSPAGGGIPPIAPPDMGGIPAHTSGASVPLMQNPDGTITSSNPSWAHLIARESSGRNVRQGIHDINSGGNEAEGYFQITPRTWAAHGGTQFAPSPLAATPQQQAAIAARILQSNPSGSDWGAGLPGRESAGALLGGLGAAPAAITPGGGPIRATLADYTRPAGTGLGMRPAGFGIPPDIPGLPGLGPQGVPGTIPGQFGPQGIGSPPNLDQTHTYSQKQQQQLGSGQGFGLTGGGLIGLLEQLPAMAASAAASAAGGASGMFGGGAAGGAAASAATAAWSDIAVPEINLAAQKGGQMIAAAAEAPLETFGLTGGQMGAPSVNPQSGWIGKILGSMLGSQFSMPNIAGSVQPPQQGGDKDSSGQGDDSSPGGKSQQEQAGGGGAAAGGGKPGPTGHKDDPIHVQQVPQPGGHPQGQATSAMNTTGVASAMTA